jgi:membrane protein YqaA with SNARE-associated domain
VATDALLLGLFASAFLSATILPGTSELAITGLALDGLDLRVLWLVATLGNVAGAVVNWWLGRTALHFQDRRWFPVGPAALSRAQDRFNRWGRPSLLLSWLPGIGDAFTLAAGVLRVPLLWFLVLVTLAKGGRYAVLLGLIEGIGAALAG